jgi:hypothetical protein
MIKSIVTFDGDVYTSIYQNTNERQVSFRRCEL